MYLSSINTYEKAYILGLIVFNIKENCSDKIIVEINFKKEKINNYLGITMFVGHYVSPLPCE